ncbi:MAG: chromate efflux transporter [Sphingomonadaceae bacterium]
MTNRTHTIPLTEATWVWLRIALLSFGGPAGQIAVMHRILVEEKRWIGEARFLHALNFCMLLPGPEAQQLATYIGWLLHKMRGGLIAGGLFVLPGALAIMVLSWIYVLYGNAPFVAGLFFGAKAAVLAIVCDAVRRIGGRALTSRARQLVAAVGFIAIFFLNMPFPLIVLGAGVIGYVATRAGSTAFGGGGHSGATGNLSDADSALGEGIIAHAERGGARTIVISLSLLILWLLPLILLIMFAGVDNRFTEIAAFFSKMAVVTFGGAYAVLAYVGQAAVDQFGWLKPTEMLDGLGMAETTPGPLIMVTQFVGFLAAYRAPGGLSPLMAGTLGGLLTTWVTFIPCFLWIFAFAPFVERLRSNKALSGALAAITAAVVGVILNLAIWFAIHFVFTEVRSSPSGPDIPVIASINPTAALLSVAALFALFRLKISVFWLLGSCALGGLASVWL